MSYNRKVWLGVFLFCVLFWSGIITAVSMLKERAAHSAQHNEQIVKADVSLTLHSSS